MDYISREDALSDAMCVGVSCQECPFLIHPVNGGCKIENYIKSIPAADVIERNTPQHTQCVESVKNALDVEERKEITLDDVLKYCKAHRLIVISEELFNRLNHIAKIPNRTEEQ